MYKPGAVVVLNSDLMPVFGVIKEIFKINTNYFFVCDVLETSCFVSRIHAYEVTYSHTVAVFNVDHLFDYHPLGLYHSPLDDTLVVSLKYHIIETL